MTKKPSTLAEQIRKAKQEFDSWTPEYQASVVLQGSSDYRYNK